MNSSVVIFLPSLDGGGAERVMLNLARGFVEQGIKVDLVLVKAEGPYLSQVPSEVRLVHLENKKLLFSLPTLVRYIQKEQPIAILCGENDANIIALWAKRLAGMSTRVVVSVHNHLSRESKNSNKLKRQLSPLLARWFYPQADAVVTVSQGVAEDLICLGLPRDNIKVIYNPIFTPELLEKAQQPLAHPWFSAQEPPVILGVGRLEKQKDFPALIRAFAQLQQQRPVRLMILGEGPERSRIEAMVEQLGLTDSVALPGFVANPYAYMTHSAVFVLSSIWEGFGNVIVEAMATGTPVVSTNCESGPAEILENGKYGKLVAMEDVEGMAEAIADTLDRPPNSTMLQQRAAEFSLEKALAQYGQVLHIS